MADMMAVEISPDLWIMLGFMAVFIPVSLFLVQGIGPGTRWLSVLGVILFSWSFFPYPFVVFVIVAAITPWLGMAAAALLRGRLQLAQETRGSDRADLVLPVVLPALGLLSGVHRFDYILLDIRLAVIATAVLALIFFTLFLVVRRPNPAWQSRLVGTPSLRLPSLKSVPWLFALLVASAGYSYAFVVFTNTLGNTRLVATYPAAITGKHTTTGSKGSVLYHLSLAPSPLNRAGITVDVKEKLYTRVEPGESVCFDIHPGRLHIRWTRLRPCHPKDN